MARIKKYAPFQNLSNFQVFENDDITNSEYFRISELTDTLTGGKNAFLIKGSDYLKETTEVKIEVLDVNGNPVYFEPGDGIPEYYEGIAKVVSMHVYDDTPIGPGKITVLGELKNYIGNNGEIIPVPDDWKGIYNVKWERNISINKNLNNETIVRFYKRPLIDITEIVKPLFDKTIPTIIQSGSVVGIPETPASGQDITTWTAGTLYKLKITDGTFWSASVDENIINIPSLGYTGRIIEVLNDKEVLVDTTYNVNDVVQPFNTASYNTSFEYTEGQSTVDTSIQSSFGIIDITRLKTFAGDVARVKIFRKSRNTAGDFQMVQESKLESNELLRDLTITTDVEINYGYFDSYNLTNYWTTSSNDHPVSINNDILASSLKFDYNSLSGSLQKLVTTDAITISNDVEYTLTFRSLLSGSISSTKTLRAYLSGADFTQDFITLSGSDSLTTRNSITQNIISDYTGSAKLVFEATGDDWYLSNVSLRNAQDTSFSPDEFTILQDIPRKLPIETFDFRFEFYDINNNYIPVDVTAFKEFDGGNDYSTAGGLGGNFLIFESDRNAFRFTTGSIANPPFQQIQLVIGGNPTGSVTYASSAFDVGGTYIDPGAYTGNYPGGISNQSNAGGLVTVANFSGSDSTYTVGSMIYTASADGFSEYETIFRLEDGEDLPTLTATSNANQFIYEPTELDPKPSNQTITIRAKRHSLASSTTPLTVNSSSDSGTPPPLTEGSTDSATGITTYSVTDLIYSASNAGTIFPQTTYSFTGSDAYSNLYSDEVTISPVINFDGISVVLSNETTAFRANSIGTVAANEYNEGDGEVNVRIGSKVIQHSDSLAVRNSFDIVSATPTAGTTANDTTPNSNTYGISNMTVDSGSMTLVIDYLAGDNTTTVSFTKLVNYTKNRGAAPVVNINVNPQNQTVESDVGFISVGTPLNVTASVIEAGTSYSYDASSPNDPYEFKITSATNATNNGNGTITPDTPSDATGTSGVITIDYRDSEGTLTTGFTIDFFVGVAIQGTDGGDGADGDDGSKVATDTVYYQLSSASQPGTPTATSYTLSSGSFSGLSSNWAGSAPIFSGSNSSKYWFSRFTANENTPGGNIASGGNLIFSTPQQAIGFSGLVTFTGDNSIDNGDSGSLSFGTGGTTTINGSNITTGLITSTNFTTGSLPYSSQGSRWNLNDAVFETENFGIDLSGNAFYKGTMTIGSTDLSAINTFNTTDPLSAGSVSYNPNMTIVDPNYDRPDGVISSFGSSTGVPGDVTFQDAAKTILKLDTIGADTSIGVAFTAFRINPDAKYNVHFRVKSNAVQSAGFYCRIGEYDSELPEGKTHVGANTSGESVQQDPTRAILQGSQYVFSAPGSADVEDGPLTTSFVDYVAVYTPTSTAKYASLVMLNWVNMGTDELHVDRVYVKEVTTDKDRGTVGGWVIDSNSIYTGTEGTDGNYTSTGITFGSTGFISAPNFYINSDGGLHANNGNFTGFISSSEGKIGGWTIDDTQISSEDNSIQLDSDTNSIVISSGSTASVPGEKHITIDDNDTWVVASGASAIVRSETASTSTTDIAIDTIQERIVGATFTPAGSAASPVEYGLAATFTATGTDAVDLIGTTTSYDVNAYTRIVVKDGSTIIASTPWSQVGQSTPAINNIAWTNMNPTDVSKGWTSIGSTHSYYQQYYHYNNSGTDADDWNYPAVTITSTPKSNFIQISPKGIQVVRSTSYYSRIYGLGTSAIVARFQGDITNTGTFTGNVVNKNSGTFKIQHPLPAMSASHNLVHCW